MTRHEGFSLVELQIALIASAIMALAMGAFASTAVGFFNQARQGEYSFDDMVYSLRKVQNAVRVSSSSPGSSMGNCSVNPPKDSSTSPATVFNWIAGGGCLSAGSSGVFGVIQSTATGSLERRFIYCPDKNAAVPDANKNILFRMAKGNNLSFAVPAVSSAQATVTLSWRINNQDYSISNTAKRRIQ